MPASRLTGVTFTNDVVSSFDYDIAGCLLELTHSLGQQTLSSFAYDYDDVGNRIQAVDTLGSAVTIDYEYDPLHRLTAADYSTGESYHYSYDAVGNRLTQQTHLDSIDYEYDAADRLIEVDGVSYTWDAKGNLLSDGVRTFTYNHANRLTQVEVGEDTYTFDYNGLGDRVRQTINETPTAYVLDLNAGLTQVLQAGSTAYHYGLGRIGEEQASGWQYHLGDALASVRQVTDPNGAVTLARSYEPFGSVLSASGGASTAYGFTGEWTDATALVFLRARYYDPATGRFMSRDTFPGLTSAPSTHHQYSYVLNRPTRYIDPSGSVPTDALISAALGLPGGQFAGFWRQRETRNGWCQFNGNADPSPSDCPEPGPLINLPYVWKPAPCQTLHPVGQALILGFGGYAVAETFTIASKSLAAGPAGAIPAAVFLGVGVYLLATWWNIAQTPTSLQGG